MNNPAEEGFTSQVREGPEIRFYAAENVEAASSLHVEVWEGAFHSNTVDSVGEQREACPRALFPTQAPRI